ncbi:MAG: hypothetical protein ACI4VF_06565, partial [Lachnospirales bacterium]
MAKEKDNKNSKIITWDFAVKTYNLVELIYKNIEENIDEIKKVDKDFKFIPNLFYTGNTNSEKNEGKTIEEQRKTSLYKFMSVCSKYFDKNNKTDFVGFDISPYLSNDELNYSLSLLFITIYEVLNQNLYINNQTPYFSKEFFSMLSKDKLECEDLIKFIAMLIGQIVLDYSYANNKNSNIKNIYISK